MAAGIEVESDEEIFRFVQEWLGERIAWDDWFDLAAPDVDGGFAYLIPFFWPQLIRRWHRIEQARPVVERRRASLGRCLPCIGDDLDMGLLTDLQKRLHIRLVGQPELGDECTLTVRELVDWVAQSARQQA